MRQASAVGQLKDVRVVATPTVTAAVTALKVILIASRDASHVIDLRYS